MVFLPPLAFAKRLEFASSSSTNVSVTIVWLTGSFKSNFTFSETILTFKFCDRHFDFPLTVAQRPVHTLTAADNTGMDAKTQRWKSILRNLPYAGTYLVDR